MNSCKDGEQNNITNPAQNTNLEKENTMLKGYLTKEQMLDTFIVVESKDPPDKAFYCKTMIISGWEILKFEPKVGKKLGIWATNGNWYTQPARLSELSGTFGFSYIFHGADMGMPYFNQAVANGFPANNILVSLKPPANWQDRIDEYDDVLGYYWDEPYSESLSLSTLSSVFSYVHANTSNKLVIGDYKPSSCFDVYTFLSDEVMVSAYSNWYETIFTCVFLNGGNDQRQLWNTMNNRYSSKNLSNWISSYKDLGEFSNLTGKAKNLGIDNLWL